MRNLNELTPSELAALQPGEELMAPSERHPRFDVLYPTHAASARLNDDFVVTLLAMQFPPSPQLFRVLNVDTEGNPTIVTAGNQPRPPAQIELAQIRADASFMVQTALMMLKQVADFDPEAVKKEVPSQFPELKDLL